MPIKWKSPLLTIDIIKLRILLLLSDDQSRVQYNLLRLHQSVKMMKSSYIIESDRVFFFTSCACSNTFDSLLFMQ